MITYKQDLYEVVENTDEDRQTNSDETVLGVVAKTVCIDDTQSVNDGKRELNEENSFAYRISELIKQRV